MPQTGSWQRLQLARRGFSNSIERAGTPSARALARLVQTKVCGAHIKKAPKPAAGWGPLCRSKGSGAYRSSMASPNVLVIGLTR